MRRAEQTNWGFRMLERGDLLTRKEAILVDICQGFDPTVDPILQGIRIKPDKDPIKKGYVRYHHIYPKSGRQQKVEFTTAIGRNRRSTLRLWIRC